MAAGILNRGGDIVASVRKTQQTSDFSSMALSQTNATNLLLPFLPALPIIAARGGFPGPYARGRQQPTPTVHSCLWNLYCSIQDRHRVFQSCVVHMGVTR